MKRFPLLIALLCLNVLSVEAQSTVNGVIAAVSQSQVQLRGGGTFVWAANATVTLADGRRSTWANLRADDAVRLTLNGQNQISALAVAGRSIGQREERLLLDVRPVQGFYDRDNETTVNGQVVTRALYGGNGTKTVVYSNAEGYDLLEATIGVGGNSQSAATAVFTVLGDGREIFRSPVMRHNSPPVRISVPIRGYSGVTLQTEASYGQYCCGVYALWANPVFVKQPPTIPVVVSPGVNARVSRSTPFVWEAVEGATGYLLELQAITLASVADADHASRFLLLRLPPETTLYTFDPAVMPKGTWRWRVHALSSTDLVGEMTEWRTFTAQ
jgi:hypothetical protein